MKLGMIRWNDEPLKCRGLPLLPLPFSPVHRARKFSAVFGQVSANSSMTIRPAGLLSIEMSKKTWGFLGLIGWWGLYAPCAPAGPAAVAIITTGRTTNRPKESRGQQLREIITVDST